MILESEKTTLKVLLLLTFLDLRLKKVLELVWKISPDGTDPDIKHSYVQYGENFIDYLPKPHEKIFYEPMSASTEPSIKLDQLISQALTMANSCQDFLVNYFLENAVFAKNFTAVIGGGFPLSVAGKKAAKLLSDQINMLNELMPYYIDYSPQEAAEIVLSIGGNMLLLTSITQEKIETFGDLIGRDRVLKYKDNNWSFEKPKPKAIVNPFYHLDQATRAFNKEFERIRLKDN